MLLVNGSDVWQYKLGISRIKVFMKFLFNWAKVNIELGAREVNQVKTVSDNDKGNIISFNVSLALASPHCKINWPTCSNVILPSSVLNLANSGSP
jgi:hypothetical protein